MRKNGFTLAEALITLGIAAIISALVVPALNNASADKYKQKVIKYYNNIGEVTNSLLENKLIYYTPPLGDPYQGCSGLDCQGMPMVAPYNNNTYVGLNKYGYLLFDALGVDFNPQTGAGTMQLPDGTRWAIVPDNNSNYVISVNMEPSDNSSCVYSANCRKPKIFRLKVNKFGQVLPGDAMTAAYLTNITSNDKRLDAQTAAEDNTNY